MKQVQSIYGQDYAPGYAIFMKKDGNFLSDGITWFQSVFESAEFIASHVLLVVDEKYGIEAAEHGIQLCYLSEYFDDPGKQVVCRKPMDIDNKISTEILAFAKKQIGNPYDYTGLILGFPLMLISSLTRWIKPLRKLPVPFHIPGSRVCSAFVADCYKHTEKYKEVKLLKQYHISRITPVSLWNEFPFKPFHFYKEREWIA